MKNLLLLIFLLTINGCYLTSQGYYQVKMLGEMQPFHEALRDPNIPDKLKKKIILVIKTREFAIQHLKMHRGQSYTHLVNLKQPYVAYNVSASHKNKLEPVKWNFPVVGKMPFLGFFKKEDAIKAEADLKHRGYDTRLRGVPAYSTLGYFNDPFYSSMMKYPDPLIINTVIHEMTHETVFIKNNVKFNEALANFVASKGTVMFIEKSYGENSKWLQFVKDFEQDGLLFADFINIKINELNEFYSKNAKNKDLLVEREKYFKKIQKDFELELLPKLKTKYYKAFPKLKLNNAYILSFRRYYFDMTLLKKVYHKLGSTIPVFLKFMRKLEQSKIPPDVYLKKWLELRSKKES